MECGDRSPLFNDATCRVKPKRRHAGALQNPLPLRGRANKSAAYAWYAYHAEQWNKLNELIPKLGTVNYKYFGGEDEFNKMLRLAKEHAEKT